MTRPERTLSNLIMHAVSATLQPTERPTAIPHLDGKVKFVGESIQLVANSASPSAQ